MTRYTNPKNIERKRIPPVMVPLNFPNSPTTGAGFRSDNGTTLDGRRQSSTSVTLLRIFKIVLFGNLSHAFAVRPSPRHVVDPHRFNISLIILIVLLTVLLYVFEIVLTTLRFYLLAVSNITLMSFEAFCFGVCHRWTHYKTGESNWETLMCS